jgi:hypothetical protein
MSDPILLENERRALATVIRDHFYATGNEMTIESTADAVLAAGFHLRDLDPPEPTGEENHA